MYLKVPLSENRLAGSEDFPADGMDKREPSFDWMRRRPETPHGARDRLFNQPALWGACNNINGSLWR
jgi:hypothetical protein